MKMLFQLSSWISQSIMHVHGTLFCHLDGNIWLWYVQKAPGTSHRLPLDHSFASFASETEAKALLTSSCRSCALSPWLTLLWTLSTCSTSHFNWWTQDWETPQQQWGKVSNNSSQSAVQASPEAALYPVCFIDNHSTHWTHIWLGFTACSTSFCQEIKKNERHILRWCLSWRSSTMPWPHR